jgi:hypothetical protein
LHNSAHLNEVLVAGEKLGHPWLELSQRLIGRRTANKGSLPL